MIYLPNGELHISKQPKSTGYSTSQVFDHKSLFKGNELRFGLVSDTHMGSTKERVEEVVEAYKIFAREGISVVYHCGDLVAGSKVYSGQENELKVWGMVNQGDYFCEKYPLIPGITTYFITGNHCLSYLKQNGADIGLYIAAKRQDLVYLDQIEATVEIAQGITLMLVHPLGGGSYALSYKLQRRIASMEGGSKPSILASGHFHVSYYMDYRNVFALQVGCFEKQTLWLKAAGLMPSCSCWLVTARINRDSIVRFQPEEIKWY